MNNILPIREEDIPCHIQIVGHYFGQEGTPRGYFRSDPTSNDGWVGCNPLGVYFDKEEKKRIKKTLTKQGWFRKLFLDDEGEIITEIVVKPCPIKDWYKRGE